MQLFFRLLNSIVLGIGITLIITLENYKNAPSGAWSGFEFFFLAPVFIFVFLGLFWIASKLLSRYKKKIPLWYDISFALIVFSFFIYTVIKGCRIVDYCY